MTERKRVTQASLIYWLYCAINRNYGQGAVISRSPLRKRYPVSRGSLRIETPAVKGHHIEKILQESGYELRGVCWTKILGDRSLYVTVTDLNHLSNRPGVELFASVYKAPQK